MPILQFSITKSNETINISRDIHAQTFTLKKAIAIFPPTDTLNMTFSGGLKVKLGFMTGNETLSNDLTNQVIIPFYGVSGVPGWKPDPQSVFVQDYDFNFNSEDIKSTFETSVLTLGGATVGFVGDLPLADQTDATKNGNRIQKIILFFEFTSLYPSIGY